MTVQRVCDFCLLDGKNNVPAVGWYVVAGNKHLDVCEECAIDAEKEERAVYYY